MSANTTVSRREYNRWIKWLRGQGYSGPFAGLTTSHECVKLLVKELRKEPPTILETQPRDVRTIVSALNRYGRKKRQPERGISQPAAGMELGERKAPLQVRIDRHQERLLNLVKNWIEEFSTPLRRFTITHLGGPGVHRGDPNLAWQTTSDGVRRKLSISVNTNMEGALLWECLHQHLETGGYSWLLQGLDEWELVGGQELQRRADLLKKVDVMLKEKLASVGEGGGEPTPFFGSILVAVLVDGLTLKYSFMGEPGVPLYATYCGGLQIGSATTPESAHAFEVYHKSLMAALDGDSMTDSIRVLKGKRDDIASAIEKGLCELMVRGYVPGRCTQCPQDR